MERGKESGEAYNLRLRKTGKRLEKKGEQVIYTALEAKLWRLDFVPQATEKPLRLFGRFAIQDGCSGHTTEGKWSGTRQETSNEATGH